MTTTARESQVRPCFIPEQMKGYLYIGGQWRDGGLGGRADITDPATGRVVGTYALATVEDIDLAVKGAHAAFEQGLWSGLKARERARVLRRASDLIRENSDELARLESLDVGKPLQKTKKEIETAAAQYEHVAALIEGLNGSVREMPFPAHAFTRREPIGVVAAISPFNFPLILATNKIAAALAMGNSVVHKPSSETTLSALYMADLLSEAGVPDGVHNVVTGPGGSLGDALVSHPLVGKVAFTGSTQVGSHIAELAGRTLKPVTAELGGNGAHLVFADADLDVSIPVIARAAMHNSGQFCMAGPRVLVERSIYETVVRRVVDAVSQLSVGHPSAESTDVGPLVSAKQRDSVAGYVQEAVQLGATVLTGGAAPARDGGYYYLPTVIVDVTDQAPIVAEEVFGPVLTVQPFDTEEEAIERANATEYGLAAGVQTRDINKAHRLSEALDAGMVWVNTWGLLDPAMPFGGVKKSGFGRENGMEGLIGYSQEKSVIIGL